MEDIEVLDLEENKNSNNINNQNINNNEKKKGKKTKVIYHLKLQNIFCVISALFILGCCVFYGRRFIKYYYIYNPKGGDTTAIPLLAKNITSNSEIVYEGSGLYHNDNYTYKGSVNNNYVMYSNMLWRIVRINSDNTIELIADEYINLLNWDNDKKDYLNSNVYDYLNNYFGKRLNKDMLAETTICTDKIDDLANMTCDNKKKSGLVNLLDIKDFLNSTVDKESYLVDDDEIFWLKDSGEEIVWHTNGSNISKSEGSNFYEIRPVITLKGSTIRYSGDGTKENPYIIDKDQKIGVGSSVKLGNDIWTIYDMDDNNYHLELSGVLTKQYRFSLNKISYEQADEGSLYEYLNTTYLDELSYKDILVEEEWNVGVFAGKYSDVTTKKVKAKIGLLNMQDIKFNDSLDNYFLVTSNKDEYIYVYGSMLKNSKPAVYHNIRPCISIAKSNTFTQVESDSIINLYTTEVK